MRRADACLAYGTRHVRDLLRMGVDPARTVVAPISALAPERPPQRESLRTPPQARFLFVGRLIESKGLDILLEAFRLVDEGELWIAGDGPLRKSVAKAAAGDRRIRLLGYVDGRTLADVYARADALIVPSLYEPWGLVVHEGLAHGLPVIATDQVGAADDLIETGVNGYVVPAGSPEATAAAMRQVAGWTPEQRARAVSRSAETLASVRVERGVDGFVRGCELALAHRRAQEAVSEYVER
jgi:glycosyltransferase involved in cell wall biosynthesis